MASGGTSQNKGEYLQTIKLSFNAVYASSLSVGVRRRRGY